MEGSRLAVICCVLLLGVEGAPTSHIYTFLDSHGLGHLAARFDDQGVTYDMLPELSDPDLRELGLITVGQRVTYRRAVSNLSSDNQQENQEEDKRRGGEEEEVGR